MHFRFSLSTLALMGMASAASFAQAQQAPEKRPPTSVGLVDVGFLMDNHPTFNKDVESLKAEIAKSQEEIETRRKDLMAQGEAVSKNFEPSSQEFKQKQEELINKESKLRVDFMDKEKKFAERNAALVATSYNDITYSIDYVAKHYGIDLVLRFSKEQEVIDPTKPRTVNHVFQRDVLYQAPGLDLTSTVQYVLNNTVSQRNGGSAPAAQTATRPGTPTRNQ